MRILGPDLTAWVWLGLGTDPPIRCFSPWCTLIFLSSLRTGTLACLGYLFLFSRTVLRLQGWILHQYLIIFQFFTQCTAAWSIIFTKIKGMFGDWIVFLFSKFVFVLFSKLLNTIFSLFSITFYCLAIVFIGLFSLMITKSFIKNKKLKKLPHYYFPP